VVVEESHPHPVFLADRRQDVPDRYCNVTVAEVERALRLECHRMSRVSDKYWDNRTEVLHFDSANPQSLAHLTITVRRHFGLEDGRIDEYASVMYMR
jgi:hypothetical protein